LGNVGPNKIATGPSGAQSYNPHIYERAMARPSGALGPPDPVVVSRKKKNGGKKWEESGV